jgi:predicted ATPase
VTVLTGLPTQLTSFVGRDAELARLDERFGEGARLITLFGPPGVGKSRLALRHAEIAGAGAARYCDLSTAAGLADVCHALARAVGVPLASGAASEAHLESLGRALAAGGGLRLVLDNCESAVAEVARVVASLSAAGAGVTFLVTSRELLGVPFELSFEVGPLRVPADERDVGAEALRLFFERARLVDDRAEWGGAQAAAAAELVRRLDGVPLALELAAGCLDVFGPVDLLARLSRSLDELADGARSRPDRHRTLRGAIDGSWALLTAEERHALAACSAFCGSFPLAGAEAVVDLGPAPGAPPVARVVAALRRKSLVRAFEPAETPGQRRFGLYESVRAYAAEKLEASGRAGEVARRHVAFYARLAAEALDPKAGAATERDRAMTVELPNLRAAHARALAGSPPDLGAALAIAVACEPSLHTYGSLGELVALLDAPLARLAEAPADEGLVARARIARACALQYTGPADAARAELDAALALARRLGDRPAEGLALASIARDLAARAPAEAGAAFEAATSLLAGAGDARRLSLALLNYAGAGRALGDFEGARERLARAAECATAAGDLAAQAHACVGLGDLLFAAGRLDEAEAELRRGEALARAAGGGRAAAQAASRLAPLLQERGRFDEARAEYGRAAQGFLRIDDRLSAAHVAGGLATLHHERGELELARRRYEDALADVRATRLGGAEGALRAGLAAVLADLDEADEARALAEAGRSAPPGPADAATVPVAVADLVAGHVELALARRAAREGDAEAAERLRAQVAARLDASAAAPGADARRERRLLARALGRSEGATPAAPGPRRLLVGERGRWFVPPSGERVDLGRQRSLRLVLLALSRHRRGGAPGGLDADALLASGWPGERIKGPAGGARVRVALSRLRALGLRDLLVRDDEGYALAPDVVVAIDGELPPPGPRFVTLCNAPGVQFYTPIRANGVAVWSCGLTASGAGAPAEPARPRPHPGGLMSMRSALRVAVLACLALTACSTPESDTGSASDDLSEDTLVHPPRPDSLDLPGAFFPESLAVSPAGAFFAGNPNDGTIITFDPGSTVARTFVPAGVAKGAFGLLVDPGRNLLWACDNDLSTSPTVSSLKGFKLSNGELAAVHPLPPGSGCADMALDGSGTMYLTDTFRATIMRLRPNQPIEPSWCTNDLFTAPDPANPVVINGLAHVKKNGAEFLYTNKRDTGVLFRVPIERAADGSKVCGQPVAIRLDAPIPFSDGLRMRDSDSILLTLNAASPEAVAAGGAIPGALVQIDVSGDSGHVTFLSDTLDQPSSVVRFRGDAWVSEGQILRLIGVDTTPVNLPFKLRRVRL